MQTALKCRTVSNGFLLLQIDAQHKPFEMRNSDSFLLQPLRNANDFEVRNSHAYDTQIHAQHKRL